MSVCAVGDNWASKWVIGYLLHVHVHGIGMGLDIINVGVLT